MAWAREGHASEVQMRFLCGNEHLHQRRICTPNYRKPLISSGLPTTSCRLRYCSCAMLFIAQCSGREGRRERGGHCFPFLFCAIFVVLLFLFFCLSVSIHHSRDTRLANHFERDIFVHTCDVSDLKFRRCIDRRAGELVCSLKMIVPFCAIKS